MVATEALVMTAPGKIERQTIEVAAPRGGQLLVRVMASGICQFDISLFTGKLKAAFPQLGGHEGVGIVEAVGDGVDGFEPGDKVTFLGGPTFAGYTLVNPAKAVRIPDDVSDYAIWISEPAACATNGVRSARVEPGDTVVLIGTGYMGMLVLQGLPKSLMSRFIVVDLDEERLELARQYGAEITLNPRECDPVAEVLKLTGPQRPVVISKEEQAALEALGVPPSAPGRLSIDDRNKAREALGANVGKVHTNLSLEQLDQARRAVGRISGGVDIVIEATGAKGTLDMATQMLRPGGRLSIFGYHTAREEVPTPLWHMNGIEVQNPAPKFSANFDEDFRDAVKLIAKGSYDQRRLITHRFRPDEAQQALEFAAGRPQGYIKGVFLFE